MNLCWILNVILVLIAAAGAEAVAKATATAEATASNTIELLERALSAERWESDERACYQDFMTTLAHAKNFTLWAVWILDSVQLPTGQLYGAVSHPGNFDECVSPWRAFDLAPHVPRFQYCMTDVILTNSSDERFNRNADVTADVYLSKKTSLNRMLSDMLWGGCVPASCGPRAVTRAARALLRTSHLAPLAATADINLLYCTTDQHEGYSTGFYIFAFALMSLILATLSLSYYHSRHEETSNTFVGEVARSFCIRRNLNELTKLRDNEIFALNFIRIISSVIIITGHTIFMIFYKLNVNTLNVEELVYGVSSYILHMDISTDTFFTMSGLLFMQGLFNDKYKSPLKYIWKRYIRLTISMMLVTAYVAIALEQQVNGPFLKTQIPVHELDACKNNWWKSLLMISNYVDPENMCNIVSWYVPCDFQLSALATLIFIVYRYNKGLAKTLLFLTIAVGTVQLGLSVLWSKLSPIPFVGAHIYPKFTPEFTDVYVKPFTHAAPFMIGAIVGYIVFNYKPKDYRKRVSKTSSYIAIAAVLCVMKMCLYGGYYYFFVSREAAPHAVAYAALHRALWSVAVCTFILVCEYGVVPSLQNFLAWMPMVPISRLSYAAYLLQFPILLYFVGTVRTLVYFDMFHITLLAISMSVLCYTSSLLVWLLLEAPLINLNNMLTYKTWKNNEPNTNGTTKVTSNGTNKLQGKQL